MLFMLLFVPTRMVAQTEYDKTVTLTALAGNPVGYTGKTDETYKNLFDGKKKEGDFSKWCCKFDSKGTYVIFEASKAGVPVGYTITTGNDNANFGCGGRNPLSWKLYGNNEGEEGEWVLIQAVENDTKLQDKNFTSYDFTCEGSTSYKYFKWEISAIHSGNTLQVGEFELKLQTCSHKNADGSSALGAVIETVDPTCAEHGYTTHECSLCHSTVKVYKDDELKAHTLTHHEATSDIKEHWQCDVCRKYFSDSNATQEVTYGSLLFDQAYAMFDDATGTLTFSYGTKPEGAYALNQERPEPEWRMQEIRTVVFDASFAYARPTSCSHWFKDCIYLTRIEGIRNLNTENVTDMSSMFLGCSSLSSLDLTNFDTGNVTDMSRMFRGCRDLTSLDVTNFNTEKVTDMSSMFQNCYDLTSLDVSNFNTSKVTDMCWMFFGCHKLTSLNVSKFNTTEVTDMSDMFENCYALTSLDLTNFNTAKVKNMRFMFYGCSALTTIYASNKFVTDKVTDNGSKMFYGCKNLKGYDDSKIDYNYANCGTDGYFTPGCAYSEFDNATGTLTFRYKGVKPEGAYGLNEGRNLPDWNNLGTNVKKVVFDASFASARPTNCYGWFKDFTNLTTIEGFEYLNTENVTNMTGVFNGCSALTSLDLTNFNTAKVTDMKLLFANCSALESLDLSMFNTENVTSMPSMFNGATNLKTLNVSNFNTEKVNNMGHMFANCPNLTSLDLSSFNTKRVEYVDNIFKNCSNLTTIYASENFAFGSGLKNGADMFLGCDKLKGFIEYNKNTDTDKNNSKFANYKTGYFTNLVGKNGDEKIGAVGEILTAENLTLNDDKDFVAYEKFAAKDATYNRSMNAGTAWGTLCLPFAIDQSKETGCKFYRLTGIDNVNDCITLESYEEGAKIPAGTPVLFKMNEGVQKLSISAQNTDLVKEPVAGTNTDVNLVGSFIKIGGKDNQGLADTDYIIGKDKFWRVSDLTGGKGVGSKPMHAYIHPVTASNARAAMLSIGKGDGTTAIDNLNAISNDANAEYYDANGRRTNGLQKGLNIVKRGSKTYKIMVK
jgi:surface protein